MLPDLKNILLETAMSFPDKKQISNIAQDINLIIPGIYQTQYNCGSEFWTYENLQNHGFKNIIRIDKHKSRTFPIVQHDLMKYSLINLGNCNNDNESLQNKDELDILELNFGEESYITTVLPNVYKAVKFIKNSLQNNNTILIIDYNNDQQKCLTIITAYLMFKHNLTFHEAFPKLQKYYKEANLDGIFVRYLYEYEPILQVQKAQDRGNSSSREHRSSVLKRKKDHHENTMVSIANNNNNVCSSDHYVSEFVSDILME